MRAYLKSKFSCAFAFLAFKERDKSKFQAKFIQMIL